MTDHVVTYAHPGAGPLMLPIGPVQPGEMLVRSTVSNEVVGVSPDVAMANARTASMATPELASASPTPWTTGDSVVVRNTPMLLTLPGLADVVSWPVGRMRTVFVRDTQGQGVGFTALMGVRFNDDAPGVGVITIPDSDSAPSALSCMRVFTVYRDAADSYLFWQGA